MLLLMNNASGNFSLAAYYCSHGPRCHEDQAMKKMMQAGIENTDENRRVHKLEKKTITYSRPSVGTTFLTQKYSMKSRESDLWPRQKFYQTQTNSTARSKVKTKWVKVQVHDGKKRLRCSRWNFFPEQSQLVGVQGLTTQHWWTCTSLASSRIAPALNSSSN